jgi:hypothetical protein
MNTFRVEYTEVKPGGHEDRQSDLILGERRDVVIYLGKVRGLVPGSVEVTEHTQSDGLGVSLGSLGF